MVGVVIVFLFALFGTVLAGCGVGLGYAFGAQFTAARIVVALCSGAGLGGLVALCGAAVTPSVSIKDTGHVIVGFILLAVVLGAVCFGVLS